jgi:hypothetical protein
MDYGPAYQRRMADEAKKKKATEEELQRQKDALFYGKQDAPKDAPSELPPIRKDSTMNPRQRSICQKLRERPRKGKVA